MKQKQVKAAPKNVKKQNVVKKAGPPKKVAAPVKEEVEEEVVEKKVVVAKKPAIKKAAPVQKKVVEKVIEEPEEEEEEDDEVDEVDEEEDVDEEEVDEEQDEEAMDEDGDEQDDDEEAEEEQDDNEEGEEEVEDDDEEPTEAPIDEEPTIPSKVKIGPIPAKVPNNQIVHITKLPKKCQQIDIVEAFAQYGPIEQVHIVTTPSGTVANVAYKTTKAATAALAAHRKVKVKNSIIEVTLKQPRKEKKEETTKDKFDVDASRDRTVYVKYLSQDTKEDEVRDHFKSCGEITRCKVISKNSTTFAFITFTNKASVEAAKKLHNSVLNDCTIAVHENNPAAYAALNTREPKLTILLQNKQQLNCIPGEKLEKIFSKCGEIAQMDILCKKNILAFITFKTEEAVQKAYKLSGKTEEGIEIEVAEYSLEKKKKSIYICNLPRDCTEEDLQTLFSRAGEIGTIILKKGFAIIHFKDTDAFCKSFLLNESFIRNQMIFVEPHSLRKPTIMKSKHEKFNKNPINRKRPAPQNGNSVFKGKKPKTPKLK